MLKIWNIKDSKDYKPKDPNNSLEFWSVKVKKDSNAKYSKCKDSNAEDSKDYEC